jgi:4-hydroxythreonine-4-phosphate dehydrogenase
LPTARQLIIYGHRALLADLARRQDLDLDSQTLRIVQPAQPTDPLHQPGAAQIAYLEAACKNISAAPERSVLVTGPICKATAHDAGFPFPGHTELLAARAGGVPVAMMMAGPRLRVVLATTHLALSAVPGALSIASVAQTLFQAARSLYLDFAIARPRVALAALNPHAGEHGAFGSEETDILTPALERARQSLAQTEIPARLSGPWPADTLFWQCVEGGFDGAVALYHDQGLIPAKMLDLHHTVNVTLGLPFVRTSPDHGVAHDLVGTGKARTDSFEAAIELGLSIWQNRHRRSQMHQAHTH